MNENSYHAMNDTRGLKTNTVSGMEHNNQPGNYNEASKRAAKAKAKLKLVRANRDEKRKAK